MPELELRRTTFTEKHVGLLFSGAPSGDETTETIEIQVAVSYERKRPVAEAQLTALLRARNVIDAEIGVLQGLRGR